MRQKQALRKVCFWFSCCGHSFAMSCPPRPPWWLEANALLGKLYPDHASWAELVPPVGERVVLRELTTQEVQMGARDFVTQFVPREPWPEARPVSPDVYRAVMDSLTDVQVARLGESVEAQDSDEEEEGFVRRRRQR